MEIFEYIEMIEKLKKDRIATTIKLSAIDAAIEALEPLCAEVSDFKVHQMSSNLISDNNSPQTKKTAYDEIEIEIPSQYSSDLSIAEMLVFALSNKPFTAHDAAAFIFELDNNLNPEMLKRRFTDIASALGRADKLNSKKIGKKNRYSLKQEDIEQKKVA